MATPVVMKVLSLGTTFRNEKIFFEKTDYPQHLC
jgi:hypothetical protein